MKTWSGATLAQNEEAAPLAVPAVQDAQMNITLVHKKELGVCDIRSMSLYKVAMKQK